MFSEVNIEVQDGNLGRNTSTGSFVHVKIGASTSDSTVPVLVTNTMKPSDIKEKLGIPLDKKVLLYARKNLDAHHFLTHVLMQRRMD